MYYTLILVTACLILVVLRSLRKYRSISIPGPTPLPVIGNNAIIKSEPHEYYKQLIDLAEKYSADTGIYRIWYGTHLYVVITGIDHIENLLNSSKIITKSVSYDFMRPWIGDGLLLSSGTKWHERRKLLTYAFHFKILDIFRKSFNNNASNLVNFLKKKTGKTFNLAPLLILTTLDIICETAMGVEINALENSESEYVHAVKRISNLLLTRCKYVWLWPDIIFNMSSVGKEHNKCLEIIHSFTKKVIKERYEMKKGSLNVNGNPTTLALLDLLLDAKESGEIDDEGIQEEVDTFMFEGHDTTSTALSWAIHLIASHNDVQERLLNEIINVMGVSQRDVAAADLAKLKFLESVIKESYRLYPTAPIFSRNVTEPIKMGDFDIPVGSTLSIFPPVMYRNAKHYKDPNKFDPDRWLEGSDGESNPFSFIPFSAGMRNCIGQKFAMMEMKVILVWLLRAFKISTKDEEKDLVPCLDIVLKPKNGINIYLEERN